MIFEIGNYQIRPYRSGNRYEIFEYRDVTCNRGKDKGKTSKKWVSTERYPATFGRALQIIYGLMLIKGDDVITGLPDAINTAKEISERLLNAIEPKE